MCGRVKIPDLDRADSDLSDEDEVEPRVLLALDSDFEEPSEQDNVTDIVISETDNSILQTTIYLYR